MLACRWIKLLTCFIIFFGKTVNDAFYSKFIHSFLDLYVHGSGSSVDNKRWYRNSTSHSVENPQLSFCLSIKSTHEFKWYIKTLWPNGLKMLEIPGPYKYLIWFILISRKMCLFGKCDFPIGLSHRVV